MNWINAAVAGVLLGGLYALYATGLSVSFGVMRLINLAHGDLGVLAAFLSSTLVLTFGGSPFWTILVLMPVGFGVGVLLQKVVFDRLVGVDPAFQIVATFGLSVVIQNALLKTYTADRRALDIGPLKTKAISIGDVSIGVFPLLRFVVAVLVLVSLSLFLGRTSTGRAFRATSDDPEAARLMGINSRMIYVIASGIAVSTVFLAGIFSGAQTNFASFDGPALLIFAFEAVIIGGLGSLWGTLAGGIALGLAQTLGAEQFTDWPAQLFGHLLFLVVLAVRPTGMFGRIEE
jgi:branched-chain amino acid transport system permease protein